MVRDDVRKGDVRSALRHYKRLTGIAPKNPRFRIKLGDLALKLERQDQAREEYLRAAALFSQAAFEQKAIAVYRRVLKFAPLDLEVWTLLVDTYQHADRTKEAIVALRTAATELNSSEHCKEAMQLRRKIAALDPTDVRTRLQLAHDLSFAQMIEEAVYEYIECVLQCAVLGEWDRIPSTFEALLALRPVKSAEAPDESRPDEPDALIDRMSTSRRYEDALHGMFRRMSELGREQARTLEAL